MITITIITIIVIIVAKKSSFPTLVVTVFSGEISIWALEGRPDTFGWRICFLHCWQNFDIEPIFFCMSYFDLERPKMSKTFVRKFWKLFMRNYLRNVSLYLFQLSSESSIVFGEAFSKNKNSLEIIKKKATVIAVFCVLRSANLHRKKKDDGRSKKNLQTLIVTHWPSCFGWDVIMYWKEGSWSLNIIIIIITYSVNTDGNTGTNTMIVRMLAMSPLVKNSW